MRCVVAAAAVLALLAGPAAAATPDWASLGLTPYESPRPAPDFSLPDLDGRARTLGELRGTVSLLFFWTTW